MKVILQNGTATALTLVEVLMIIVVAAVLIARFMPVVSHHPGRAMGVRCCDNLRQIGMAFEMFAADHKDRFPAETPVKEGGTKGLVGFESVAPYFLIMSNELMAPKILICPADNRTISINFAETKETNISYFVGPDARYTNGQSFLAGDRNITNGEPGNNRILLLTTNMPIGWTKEIHQYAGNVVLSDGSVQRTTSSQLLDLLRESGMATNRLAIP